MSRDFSRSEGMKVAKIQGPDGRLLGWRVGELMAELSSRDPNDTVIVSSDAEENEHHELMMVYGEANRIVLVPMD